MDSQSYEDKIIHSFHQFVNRMENPYPFPGQIWYRGQTQDWPLLPSVARCMNWGIFYFLENCKNEENPWNNHGTEPIYYVNELKESMQKEQELLLRFVRESSAWFSANRPQNFVEWYHLAQHHGVPTRLLDWTCDPLVALWFAVNSEDEEDGYIYTYNVSKQETLYDLRKTFNNEISSEEWEKHVIESIFSGTIFPSVVNVVPISPFHYNLRQSRQTSFFTLHIPYRYLKNSFWSERCYSEDIDHTILSLKTEHKYCIHGRDKALFRKYLIRMGRHLWSIFPDMDHLADGLVREIFSPEN